MHPLQGASFLSTPLQGGILKPPALRVVADSAVRSSPQEHRDRTRETVEVDFLIGPMIQRPPTTDVSIFHVLQDVCNVELTSIGENDLFIMSQLSVGHKNVFAQIGL